jgi:hypothetical protein
VNDLAQRGESFLLPRLQIALARAGNTHNWADVLTRIGDGRAQFWQSQDGRGALVTELLNFPNLTAINYWLGAGELHACHALVPGIEAWAKAQGVTRAIGMGRPGFARILGSDGVVVAGVAYRKELAK